MAFTYTYLISTDFPNGSVNVDDLTVEIDTSSITTGVLQFIDLRVTGSDNCDITFDVQLSAGDKTTLDGIVAAHTGEEKATLPFGEGWIVKVEDDTLTTPPATPDPNDFWLVPAAGATGDWASHGDCIARKPAATWKFFRPRPGLTTYISASQSVKVYIQGTNAWTLLQDVITAVQGPSTTTLNSVARWDSTTGMAIKDSNVILNDADQIDGVVTCTFSSEHNNGTWTGAGAKDVDWNNGQKQTAILGADTTVTFTDPPGASNLLLRLVQDGTGSRTVTWPGSVLWAGGAAPTLSTAANAEDIITFYYNGTSYYGVASLNFA